MENLSSNRREVDTTFEIRFDLEDHLIIVFLKKQIIVTLVSEVTHKSVIEVNEEGSEAAAVTAVVVSTRSRRPKPTHISMIFDRLFYFIIQDKTHNLNLFMGRIVDPSGVHNL